MVDLKNWCFFTKLWEGGGPFSHLPGLNLRPHIILGWGSPCHWITTIKLDSVVLVFYSTSEGLYSEHPTIISNQRTTSPKLLGPKGEVSVLNCSFCHLNSSEKSSGYPHICIVSPFPGSLTSWSKGACHWSQSWLVCDGGPLLLATWLEMPLLWHKVQGTSTGK